MAFTATAIVVLVASPGDTAEERAAIQLQLNGWNVTRGKREGVVAVPWLYEHHSVPVLGGHPQSVINAQAVDKADVVVAFFDSRLGTETLEAVSGTAEEIKRAHSAGKPVHVYFSTEPLPRSVDPDQLARLGKFKSDMQSEGLLGAYSSPEDLAAQVSRAIDYDVDMQKWSASTAPATPATGVHLVARSSDGSARNVTVKNVGTVDAQSVTLQLAAQPGKRAPKVVDPTPVEITRGGEHDFQLNWAGHDTENVHAVLKWAENGVPQNQRQSLSLAR